jgi:hypothetical protein
MIVTIKTASANSQFVGMFEAMKYGLETERYSDNTFDLVASDMTKVNAIADYCKGKIVSIVDGYTYPTYES